MPDYNALRATALSLIQSFGSNQTATLIRVVPGVYDPLTDSDPGQTVANYVIACTVLPASDDQLGGRTFDDLAMTNSVNIYLPMTGLPVVPLPGDRIVLPGQAGQFAITDVKNTAPDGVSIFYKCAAEKTADGP